jgi:magnesium chelatase family protein
MVATVKTMAFSGINAIDVTVQVQITSGLASFQTVGLATNAVRESKERVRGAFHALGISLPAKRITVNLQPADINKEGNHYDLPIAVGLLVALGVIPQDSVNNSYFLGELGLNSALAPISGAIVGAIHAAANNAENLYVTARNAPEAAWAQGTNVYALTTLKDLIDHLKGTEALKPQETASLVSSNNAYDVDFMDVRGQESVKRAAEIAAAGGHNMLMCGPPGSGKSMIAARMATIMPSLVPSEALETSMIHSIAGMLNTENGLITDRPFRSPHHSASAVALCGGGMKALPGEMSLAQNGILFLDELPEFPRAVLETLRQPLETGDITVSRANHHITYPADFQFIAAMNPSPCGYYGHPTIPCTSSVKQIENYRNRLSGPLMDRIDIHINVPAVELKDLQKRPAKEGSADIQGRVEKARIIQSTRYNGTSIKSNAKLSGKMLDTHCQLSDDCAQLITKANERLAMSGRAYHRILRVSRTIADLGESQHIEKAHILEALGYRYVPFSVI